MARGAVLGSRLVEENRLRRNHAGRLVTRGATHVLMRASQREARPLLVVKQGRFPLCAVVALGTACNLSYRKLLRVDIFVAVFTGCWRRFEIDIDQFGLEIRWLVAVLAGCCTMSSQQRKFRL